jgi:hypothetical protein
LSIYGSKASKGYGKGGSENGMGFPFIGEFSKLVTSGVPATKARNSRREVFPRLFSVFTVIKMINRRDGYRILGRPRG